MILRSFMRKHFQFSRRPINQREIVDRGVLRFVAKSQGLAVRRPTRIAFIYVGRIGEIEDLSTITGHCEEVRQLIAATVRW
jgi:hypothetical protein